MNQTEEMAKKLISMGKKGFCANWQDNALLKSAGKRLLQMQDRISQLLTEITDKQEKIDQLEEEKTILDERIAIMLGEEPPEDETAEGTAPPGEAAEDFWDDMWPLEP